VGIIQESYNNIDIYSEKIKEYEKQFDISKLIPYEYSEDVDPSELKLEQVLLDVQNIERRKEEAIREKRSSGSRGIRLCTSNENLYKSRMEKH
jgi:hypothetical protein